MGLPHGFVAVAFGLPLLLALYMRWSAVGSAAAAAVSPPRSGRNRSIGTGNITAELFSLEMAVRVWKSSAVANTPASVMVFSRVFRVFF